MTSRGPDGDGPHSGGRVNAARRNSLRFVKTLLRRPQARAVTQ